MKVKERDIKAAYKEHATRVRSELAAPNSDKAKDFTPNTKVIGLSLFKLYNYNAFRSGYLAGSKKRGL